MSFKHPKLNLVGIAVAAASAAFMTPNAFASPPVDGEAAALEVAPVFTPVSGAFDNADLSEDGLLDLSEFTLYAGNQAVAGDPDFTAIVSSGDYETAFKLMDADGSGALSEDEVTGQSDGLDMDGDMRDEGHVTQERAE